MNDELTLLGYLSSRHAMGH